MENSQRTSAIRVEIPEPQKSLRLTTTEVEKALKRKLRVVRRLEPAMRRAEFQARSNHSLIPAPLGFVRAV